MFFFSGGRKAIFRFNIKLSISNGFDSAFGNCTSVCRFNAVEGDPNRPLDDGPKETDEACFCKTSMKQVRYLFFVVVVLTR